MGQLPTFLGLCPDYFGNSKTVISPMRTVPWRCLTPEPGLRLMEGMQEVLTESFGSDHGNAVGLFDGPNPRLLPQL